MSKYDFTPLFDRAMEQEFGMKVETNNPKHLQVQLCDWNREHDNRWDEIIVCIPSTPNKVFLVKKSVELD